MSRGSAKFIGCGTTRRTSAAPTTACRAAPQPMTAGSAKAIAPLTASPFSHQLTPNAPSATAGATRQP